MMCLSWTNPCSGGIVPEPPPTDPSTWVDQISWGWLAIGVLLGTMFKKK
jgi:hypothetical protein